MKSTVEYDQFLHIWRWDIVKIQSIFIKKGIIKQIHIQ